VPDLWRSNSSTGDRLWGGEFLECAIEGFWEAIAQWLQLFAEDLGDF
jgi:hypothetical protein